MRHIYSLADANLKRPSVVSIGVFDGVHRGHQHVIQSQLSAAQALDAVPVVLTFFPYPELVIGGKQLHYYLTLPEEKAALLHELGIELVVTHPFNDEVRQVRAATFVDRLLEHLQMVELWVGADFVMGYQREGNIEFLQSQAKEKEFKLHVVDLMDADGERISSSRVRHALDEGDVGEAAHWLGRPFRLSGEVVKGAERGRTIGIPTANLLVEDEQALPAHGVYAAWALVGDKRFKAMVNIGVRPTFDEGEQTVVEAHLLDFEADLYGQTIALDFTAWLRGEQRFSGIEALVTQIKKDVEQGRRLLDEQKIL